MRKILLLILLIMMTFNVATSIADVPKVYWDAGKLTELNPGVIDSQEIAIDILNQEYVRYKANLSNLSVDQQIEKIQMWADLESIWNILISNHDGVIETAGGASKAMSALIKTQKKAVNTAQKALKKAILKSSEAFIAARYDLLNILDVLSISYCLVETQLGINVPNGTQYTSDDWGW